MPGLDSCAMASRTSTKAAFLARFTSYSLDYDPTESAWLAIKAIKDDNDGFVYIVDKQFDGASESHRVVFPVEPDPEDGIDILVQKTKSLSNFTRSWSFITDADFMKKINVQLYCEFIGEDETGRYVKMKKWFTTSPVVGNSFKDAKFESHLLLNRVVQRETPEMQSNKQFLRIIEMRVHVAAFDPTAYRGVKKDVPEADSDEPESDDSDVPEARPQKRARTSHAVLPPDLAAKKCVLFLDVPVVDSLRFAVAAAMMNKPQKHRPRHAQYRATDRKSVV